MLYYELYKKDKFLTKIVPIHSHKFVFSIAKNTIIFNETSHEYSWNNFYDFLKHKNIVFKYLKNREHWASDASEK
jgi:hypothetical protein